MTLMANYGELPLEITNKINAHVLSQWQSIVTFDINCGLSPDISILAHSLPLFSRMIAIMARHKKRSAQALLFVFNVAVVCELRLSLSVDAKAAMDHIHRHVFRG